MFNLFGKKKSKEEALEYADKKLNKGLSGMMMKGFVPKEHRDMMNQSLNQAKQAHMASTGAIPIAATATVLSITDTGKLVNFDPIVILALTVTESDGRSYQKTMETLVSKLQIPRPGDQIGLGQNPANPSELIYMGLLTP